MHGKSNEITAIPALLESLQFKGRLVSIDAIRCQRDVASQICEQGGDYFGAVKGKQLGLQSAIKTMFIDSGDALISHGTAERSYGREVAQLARVLPAAGRVDAQS